MGTLIDLRAHRAARRPAGAQGAPVGRRPIGPAGGPGRVGPVGGAGPTRPVNVRPVGPAPTARGRTLALPPTVVFAFDVASPWTYLAAEGVERLFGDVVWRPVTESFAGPCPGRGYAGEQRARAEARAARLRLPLVWPDRLGGEGVRRASAYAASAGRGGPFALAAGRLAYGGGFCLDDRDTLAEAAAAAGLAPGAALLAAADPSWDDELAREAGRLVARGAEELPALLVGRTLLCGENALPAAAAVARGAAY